MTQKERIVIGRLAPSPTGYLHLGNAWSFLLAWLSARLGNGKIFLRMEDIDPARSKPEFIDGILEDFAWLGLDYDGEIVFQSRRLQIYEEYLQKISPFVYPCFCTRKELREVAGAPQITAPGDRLIMPDMGAVYHRTCRFFSPEERKQKTGKNACLRLACPPFEKQEYEIIPEQFHTAAPIFSFNDLILGKQKFDLNACGGDFAVQRSDKVWAYQFAVSIDDMLMGINQVVRGADILTSTPRQLYLFQLFGHTAPEYAHIPLLLDPKGKRLAKRHASLSLKTLRQKYKSPAPLIQYLSRFLAVDGNAGSARELLACLKEKKIQSFPWAMLKQYENAIQTNFT
mgnify:FL=1